MLGFLKRQWFLILLACTLIPGFLFPLGLSAQSRDSVHEFLTEVPQKLLVASILFVMALPMDTSAMWLAFRRPVAVSLAVFVSYVVAPLLAWGISGLLPGELAVGLIIAGISPCTVASAAVWTRRAGGNDAVAVLVTVITNLVSFLMIPFWLFLLTGKALKIGQDVDPLKMILDLALLVLLPTVLAQLLRLYAPMAAWSSRNKLSLSVFAQFGVLANVLFGAVHGGLEFAKLSEQGKSISWILWGAMFLSVALIHLFLLGGGHLLGLWIGLSRADRIAVGFSGSQKTLLVGLHVALSYFGGLAMIPMVVYHLVQLVLDTLIADWLKKRHAD